MKASYTLNSLGSFMIALTVIISCQIFFSNAYAVGVPVDKDGDTIPAPTGNIPYISMPGALCSNVGEFTWDYSGTLANKKQEFSFQSSIFQVSREGELGIGFHIFQFGFEDQGNFFYGNSTYGGEDKVSASIIQSMDLVSASVSQQNFSLVADSIFEEGDSWTVESYKSPIVGPPLYKGLVGQPGHQYAMNGTGRTFLWRYDASGNSEIVPYTYKVNVIMVDERGSVMEGLGGGYVGPSLVPLPDEGSYFVETEIAQPRLRVDSWEIVLKLDGTKKTGFKSKYKFSGKDGMLWNDFGPVVRARNANANSQSLLSLGLSPKIKKKIKSKSKSNNLAALKVAHRNRGVSLYNGNWLPVSFTEGRYKGTSIVFFTFWNKTEENPPNQTTSDPAWSTVGWTNLFTGVVPERVASAYSVFDTLYPENPNQPEDTFSFERPYIVKLDSFVDPKYKLAFPWAQKVTLVVKANTKLRHALADYANSYYPEEGLDDPGLDLEITLEAISPVTQNTLFSESFSQYYEGAAVPTIDGESVGFAWIEHMR